MIDGFDRATIASGQILRLEHMRSPGKELIGQLQLLGKCGWF
jgi:hypothetical protein